MDAVIVGLWVALSVFVVWHWAAMTFLRWLERRSGWGSGPASVEDGAQAEEYLRAQSEGLDSAWETIRGADS